MVETARAVSDGVFEANRLRDQFPGFSKQSSHRKKFVLHCYYHDLSTQLCHSVRVPMYQQSHKVIALSRLRRGETSTE